MVKLHMPSYTLCICKDSKKSTVDPCGEAFANLIQISKTLSTPFITKAVVFRRPINI